MRRPARIIGFQLTGEQAEHEQRKNGCSPLKTERGASFLLPRQNGRGLPKSLNLKPLNQQHASTTGGVVGSPGLVSSTISASGSEDVGDRWPIPPTFPSSVLPSGSLTGSTLLAVVVRRGLLPCCCAAVLLYFSDAATDTTALRCYGMSVLVRYRGFQTDTQA